MHERLGPDLRQEVSSFYEQTSALGLRPIPETALRKGRRIGAGTFSVVWEAFLESDEQKTHIDKVALKELRSARHEFRILRLQLLSEASVLARLRHPNIIGYVGCGVASAKLGTAVPFMVQEFLPGGSLDEYLSRLRRRRIAFDPRYAYSLATALRWTQQVASAVAYLHSVENGIVHRDIKLANLLMTERSVERANVKLADFGLSVDLLNIKSVDQMTPVKIASWKCRMLSNRTKNHIDTWMLPENGAAEETCLRGRCFWPLKQRSEPNPDDRLVLKENLQYYQLTEETGSYMYMSPEVWLGLPYNEKADIYSLGVLIAELLTGRPFSSCLLPEKSYEEAKNFSYCVANGLRLRCPRHFPKPIASILDACWDPDPLLRPTAGRVRDVLNLYSQSVVNTHQLPLLQSMALTSLQKIKLGFSRLRYLQSPAK